MLKNAIDISYWMVEFIYNVLFIWQELFMLVYIHFNNSKIVIKNLKTNGLSIIWIIIVCFYVLKGIVQRDCCLRSWGRTCKQAGFSWVRRFLIALLPFYFFFFFSAIAIEDRRLPNRGTQTWPVGILSKVFALWMLKTVEDRTLLTGMYIFEVRLFLRL